MSTRRFVASMATLALGSLLIIGAGCAGGTAQTPAEGGAVAPRTGTVTRENGGQPDFQPTTPGGAPEKAPAAPEGIAPTAPPTPAAAASDTTAAREIKISATRFAFTPAEIRVKKGEKIKLTLTNKEGAHGIDIPALNVELKGGEGETVSTTFVAGQAGSFPFFCDVFCGSGHRDMRGALIVE